MKKLLIFIASLLIIASGFFVFLHFQEPKDSAVEIVFSENITSYSPYTLDFANKQRLRLIYEPLIQLDSNLSVQPALANSYGRLDDLTWELTLAPNIQFQDGTKLDADLVVKNFDRYKTISDFSGITANIATVEAKNPNTILITTKEADANLLNKISNLYITPNTEIQELEKNPNGTGPYSVFKIQKNKLSLVANPTYHGRPAIHSKLVLTSISNPLERIRYANDTPNVIALIPAPSSFTEQLNSRFELEKNPTNSVNFFLFNFNRPALKSLALRQFLNQIFSDEFIAESTNSLGTPSTQYVSKGVYGHNPNLQKNKLTQEEIIQQVKSTNLAGLTFKIALPEELEIFSEILILELSKFAILPDINFVPASQLLSEQTIQNNDLIYLGWKSDYGNSASFFENFALPNLGLNKLNYANPTLTSLFENYNAAKTEQEKLDLLRQAMQVVTLDDPIGIPLFETEEIYAINNKYSYAPRIDGYFDPNNLILK